MPEELILKTKIKRESGWLYLLDKDGDVCRTKMCGIIQHDPPKYEKPEKILSLFQPFFSGFFFQVFF